jgi:signal peptidase I
MRRTIWAGAVVAVAVAGWLWLLMPTALGGQTSYISTDGNSMQPQFHTGDLAVLRPADHYGVGDVVAYHSALLHTVVMHRIVAAQNGYYTFKGDSNAWLDPEHPTAGDFLGKLTAQVPQGGVWLNRLSNPPALGLAVFGLLATGGTAAQTRRRRRRTTVSRYTNSGPGSILAVNTLPPQLRAAAAIAAAVGVLGVTLGALAWAGPLDTPGTTQQQTNRSMTFSYTAAVPRTAAYDTTTVISPDPVFRKLANIVDVHYSYRGDPGTVAVNADLSTTSGWHSTIPLAAAGTSNTGGYEGTVRLDLTALDDRAQAAALATGIPANQVDVAVTPLITTSDGTSFAPSLQLTLSPLQLTVAGGAKALTVTDAATVLQATPTASTLGLLGHQLKVATARMLAVVLLLAALLSSVVLAVLARRSRPTSEAAGIRRRYGPLLVAIHPMPTPTGRPVVEVTEFATLARLAERYGLLVLHWSRSDVETFVVQDEGTTYRYRTGAGTSPSAAPVNTDA